MINGFSARDIVDRKITGKRTIEISTSKKFHLFAASFMKKEGSVLLLSGGDGHNARFNILAVEPWLKITSKKDTTIITEHNKHTRV